MTSRPRRFALLLLVPVVLAAVFLLWRGRDKPALYATVSADRGDVVDVVGATGVLQAVVTVQVGSQVSGTIKELHADFNSRVKKGQVIARLEPSAFVARVNQAQANLATARANVDRSQAAIDDARQKYERALELSKQDLVPAADLESARASYQSALAQHQANRAAVKQAEASLHQAEVDLDHTVITAPVDGVVLARNVDVGQTVAASFQAPVLFVIANDLTRMQVNASIDEADIGRVQAGQDVTFRVDAYPEESFGGRVEQVRLQPVTANNVVTYNTIITVDNPRLRLMPGMTATVSVIVQSRSDVVRIPSAALRFRPEGFADPRAAGARGQRSARGAGGGGDGSATSAGGRERGVRTASVSAERGARGPREGSRAQEHEGPRDGRPGLLFVLGPEGQPQPTRVRLGISDGRYVEVVQGLAEGAQVVTGVMDEARPQQAPSPGATNPFAPQRPQRRSR